MSQTLHKLIKKSGGKEGESGGGNEYVCLLWSFQLIGLFYFYFLFKGIILMTPVTKNTRRRFAETI